MATVCPITTRLPKYPGEIPIPAGHAGQMNDGLILCHQLRTIDLARVSVFELGGRPQQLTDPRVRAEVRVALAHQLGLDLRAIFDGAA